MSAKPRWKGTLQIGLVNVPVQLFTTKETKSQAPVGHQVHRECQTQSKNKKWCTKCDKEIPDTELMKGYDAPSGKGFVELSDDEVKSLKVASTKVITVTTVADVSRLDPLMIEETFYLTSDGTTISAEAEAVLIEALRGKIGIGTLALNGRERHVGVMVYDDGLIMHSLRPASRMREVPVELLARPAANPQMVALAKQLVASMEGEIDLSQTRDAYADALKALVASRANGEEPDVATPEAPSKVVSLFEALRASLANQAVPTPIGSHQPSNVAKPKRARAK